MITVSPYKSFFKAAVIISFDYETSACSFTPKSWKRVYKYLLELSNRYRNTKKRTNSGLTQREGAEMIFEALTAYNLHATWFGTGHTLLKGNENKKEYRINQTLPSCPHPTRWREKTRTFDSEPFSNYKKRKDYYFGDLTEKLRDRGEDIQCHTFSHPVLALEPIENIIMDLEDWQSVASRNSYPKAQILAFPFLADCFYYYPELKISASYKIPGKIWEIEPISAERLEVIHQSGIELITRCGSKNNENPFKSFRKYNDSPLFYATNRTLHLGDLNKNAFDKEVKEIIRNGWLIDYWCHPHNVSEYPIQNFLNFLDIISGFKNTKELWIPTFKEAWDHFKKVQNIKIIYEQKDIGDIIVTLMNNNETDISEIGVDVDPERFIVEKKEGIQIRLQDFSKIVVSSIPAKSSFNFILRNSDGRSVD